MKVLDMPEGRRFVWAILTAGLLRGSFSPNPYETAFREGVRSVSLKVMREMMKANARAFAQMQNEAEHDHLRAVAGPQEED